jgi:hypothetical protein
MLLESGATQVTAIRIYLCGDEKVGKTTLVTSLPYTETHLHIEDRPRTKGIEISQVEVASEKRCRVFDFAGQFEYRVHHDLFMLPESALFVVLFNVGNPADAPTQLRYWLRYICSVCPREAKPRVLLVGSHADLLPTDNSRPQAIDRTAKALSRVRVDFRSDVSFVEAPDNLLVNCQDPTTLGPLRSLLATQCDDILSGNVIEEPEICAAITIALQNYRAKFPADSSDGKFVTWSQYEKILSEYHLRQQLQTEEVQLETTQDETQLDVIPELASTARHPTRDVQEPDAPPPRVNPPPRPLSPPLPPRFRGNLAQFRSLLPAATRYLHRFGELYWDDQGLLQDYIILDLRWLHQHVLGLVMCPEDLLQEDVPDKDDWITFRGKAEEGPVTPDLFPFSSFPSIGAVDVIKLLQRFLLCAQIIYTDNCENPRDHLLFPALLQSRPSEVEWQQNDDLGVHVGLKLTCSNQLRMLPPGFFPRIQTILAQKTAQENGVIQGVWRDAIRCGQLGLEMFVQLLKDENSVIVLLREPSSRWPIALQLLKCLCGYVQDALEPTPGVQLLVEYCSAIDLASCTVRAPDIRAFPLLTVLKQRMTAFQQQQQMSVQSKTLTEKLHLVCGIPPEGMISEGWLRFIVINAEIYLSDTFGKEQNTSSPVHASC